MQEIKAYIRKPMLDQVIDALAAIPGLPGIAIVNLQEYGHGVASGSLVKTSMCKLEIDIPDELVEQVVDTIVTHGRTEEGHPGDGKVFISSLKEAVRIADGTRGRDAVSR